MKFDLVARGFRADESPDSIPVLALDEANHQNVCKYPVANRYVIPGYLFTLVRPGEWEHSVVIMLSVLLLIAFSVVFVNGQTREPWVSLSQLANERQDADDFAAAEKLRREALRLAEEKLGLVDKQLAPLLANLAVSLHSEGRDAEADPLARRAFFLAEQSGDQKLTGQVLNTLGVVLAGQGELARAEPVLRRSVALLEQSEGADALEVAKAACNLATLYAEIHQFVKAEQELALVLPVYERHLGPEHPAYAMALGSMFTILYEQHRVAEGEPYLRRALAVGEKVFPESVKMANLQHCLAAFEMSREHFKEAARLLEKVIATEERMLGHEHPELAHALVNYSYVLRRLHQKNDAKLAQNRANSILKSFH
jgi:tetratricopeptide (TPR) repeat protein